MTWNRYVALGDSITEGYGMDPVEGIEPLPWVERVGRAVAREHHNLGRRDMRARQIVETQLERAIDLQPDLVSIAAGPNDLLYGLDTIAEDLEPLYAAFKDVDVFTFTYMDMPRSGLLPDEAVAVMQPRMEELHGVVREMAGKYGALVIDIYADPESRRPDFYSSDLRHANARGHAYVAEKTITTLSRSFQHA